MPRDVSVTLSSAADTWSAPLSPVFHNKTGKVNVSIDADSAWDGVIRLQRQGPGESGYKTVQTYAGDLEEYFEDDTPGALYRIGQFAADYSAGSAAVKLTKQAGDY